MHNHSWPKGGKKSPSTVWFLLTPSEKWELIQGTINCPGLLKGSITARHNRDNLPFQHYRSRPPQTCHQFYGIEGKSMPAGSIARGPWKPSPLLLSIHTEPPQSRCSPRTLRYPPAASDLLLHTDPSWPITYLHLLSPSNPNSPLLGPHRMPTPNGGRVFVCCELCGLDKFLLEFLKKRKGRSGCQQANGKSQKSLLS